MSSVVRLKRRLQLGYFSLWSKEIANLKQNKIGTTNIVLIIVGEISYIAMANWINKRKWKVIKCKRQPHKPSEPWARQGKAKMSRISAKCIKQPVVLIPRDVNGTEYNTTEEQFMTREGA